MKKLLVIASFAACASAFAAPPTKESVENLLNLSKADQVLDAVYGNIEQSMRQGMQAATAGKTLTPQQQQLLQTMPAKMAAVLRQELNWNTLKPLLVQVYSEIYDQEEIDGMATFFRSPIGQRFVDKQAAVAVRSAQATQQMLAPMIPKIQAAMAESLKEAGIEPGK